jgi:2-polyprenyl-6-methoxyphenol hydroxylase-like FAD-dependent oxidoreductase
MASSYRNPAHDVPVLIAGGGPVGLTMALLLAKHGITSTIVERRPPRTSSAPKAHVVNPRSLEIFKSLGIDIETLRQNGASRGDAEVSRFMTRLSGTELGHIPLDVPEHEAHKATPTPLLNIAQPKLESYLAALASENSRIDYRLGDAWVACRAENGGVVSTIEQGEGRSYSISSSYLVAADGANSSVREFLDIPMDGIPAVRPRITIHFEANLRHIVRDRPAILYWILDPSAAGTFIAYDIDQTWVYTPRVIPEQFDREQYSDAVCIELIRKAIGRDGVDLRIQHVVPWMMAAQVATSYRQGSVLLVGDAAHRFPPTGGFGLNTGIQDAHNLAWKIASVLRHPDDDALLDSYDRERRPIAEINTRQSLHNSNRMPDLFRLAEETIVDGQVSAADARRLAAEIGTHREHFLSPGLQLGYCYGPPVRGPAEPTRYDPSARDGDRMPHAWVACGQQRLSTLDLLDPTSFTLLAGRDGATWRSAVSGFGSVMTVILDDSFMFESDWLNLCGLVGTSAMLVRPDGHIAKIVADDSPASRAAIVETMEKWGIRPGDGGRLARADAVTGVQ